MSHGNKKFNKYDLSGCFGIGKTFNTNEEFYFDLEDYDKIKNYCWFVENGCGRLVSRNYKTNGKTTPIKFHRLILEFPELKYDIDHINGNQLDNRKANLQLCKHSENIQKRKKQKDNSSGVTGVHYRKDTNKWTAKIEKMKVVYNLGCFVNIEDAIIARLKAEMKYFGDFAPQKYLFEKYNILSKGE